MNDTSQRMHRRTTRTNRRLSTLETLETRLRWLSSWTIHHANHLRQSSDGVKVGGHQASCASMAAIMAALYGDALRPNDRVAVKPHGGPLLHALHYLAGNQSRKQMENFRGFGGMQSYPSRTKDCIPVDFSTGSVGLGVAITAFASLVQDYLIAQGRMTEKDAGRMIALMGDAELDEGNIYECLIEGYKHDVRNCWWIVDYNRQSLDATTADRMFSRFDDIFETCGWRVLCLKYGRKQREAFSRDGGEAVREWIDSCPNAIFSALTYQGGAAWRERLIADIGRKAGVKALLESYDDAALADLMTNLGGHCLETLTEAFAEADDERPTMFICYTVKGFGLPFAGHKDNHAGLMTSAQVADLRDNLQIAEGAEWEPYGGLQPEDAQALAVLVESLPLSKPDRGNSNSVDCTLPRLSDAETSTQAAFGKILFELSKQGGELADSVITTSPDVTVSTNLGAWVNQRGLFRRQELEDVFQKSKIPSAQKWQGKPAGQHLELGIAENNLFLALAAMGLAEPLFGSRLFPVGTVYDPFISRGLDALNYGCYQDSRFMLVATPSGITLGPEGGAHQSIATPLIGATQPGLTYFEPAYADELHAAMEWGFDHMQRADGGAVYLRLSTRPLPQPERDDDWREPALKGAYWLREPDADTPVIVAFTGAIVAEVMEAADMLAEDIPCLGVLNVTSSDMLHRDWSESLAQRWTGTDRQRQRSHVERLLDCIPANAAIVTVLDGAPQSLGWIGGVQGHRVVPLGVTRFGQTGNLADLYREYRLDANAIVQSVAELVAGA